jgi:hypothetical protein
LRVERGNSKYNLLRPILEHPTPSLLHEAQHETYGTGE